MHYCAERQMQSYRVALPPSVRPSASLVPEERIFHREEFHMELKEDKVYVTSNTIAIRGASMLPTEAGCSAFGCAFPSSVSDHCEGFTVAVHHAELSNLAVTYCVTSPGPGALLLCRET